MSNKQREFAQNLFDILEIFLDEEEAELNDFMADNSDFRPKSLLRLERLAREDSSVLLSIHSMLISSTNSLCKNHHQLVR